jgi:hypothetical protein
MCFQTTQAVCHTSLGKVGPYSRNLRGRHAHSSTGCRSTIATFRGRSTNCPYRRPSSPVLFPCRPFIHTVTRTTYSMEPFVSQNCGPIRSQCSTTISFLDRRDLEFASDDCAAVDAAVAGLESVWSAAPIRGSPVMDSLRYITLPLRYLLGKVL